MEQEKISGKWLVGVREVWKKEKLEPTRVRGKKENSKFDGKGKGKG